MKKLIAFLLVLVMMLCVTACAEDTTKDNNGSTPSSSVNPNPNPSKPGDDKPQDQFNNVTLPSSPDVMSYADYMAAAEDDAVEVECYVQATQSWWDNSIVIYAEDPDGAYFGYKVVCSEEDAAKLTPGTKINIKGFKTFYKGMPEIAEGATFTFVNDGGFYISEAQDVTALLGNDTLVEKAGIRAAFKGMKVEPIANGDGVESAFLYNWDGSGSEGSDLYFNVSVDGKTYNFCVESYLCGADTDVYKAVQALQIGDVIDMEGFLYWYDGVNPHITSVTKAA